MRALIVDDDEFSLDLLQSLLSELGYEVDVASDGAQALAKLRNDSIHLVITDWEMPAMNGLELCRAIRDGDFEGYVYVVMLTSRDSGPQRIEALHAGADAFLVKPLNPQELLVSLKTAERILGLETRDLAIFALAKLSESRDPETGAHIERVQSYARLLAQYLSTTEKYHGVVDPEYVRLIFQTSPLHDIGKVGIPDNVLLKPGKLSEQEFMIMRTHASLGAQTLEASLGRFPNARFLQTARDIALSHHERWDGKGYPNGLAGQAIPLCARIVALADVYDALTSRRIYRDAMSHATAKQLILRERGAQFDPDIVDAFVETEKQFIGIRERFRDDDQPAKPTEAPRLPTVAAVAQVKVMVVDDDPIIRDMLCNFMNAQGVECIACADALEAVALFLVHRPTIMISDWEMPKVDGLELCRRIRAMTEGTQTHVHFIMLTVYAGKEQLYKAFDAGVDDFLGKPFNEVELIARFRAGLRAVALYEELSRQHQGSRILNEQLTSVNRTLEKLAVTDELTGLSNRRQGIHRLEELWAMADRYPRALAVISLDVDHFKKVNDVHGHSAGDTVLVGVSDRLRECVRTTDTVCRVGGEEFLIILPSQTMQEAEICAQRCRQAVMLYEFQHSGQTIRATISAGIASRRSDMLSCSELLKEADDALYAAKRAGRNTVCCARPDAAERPATTAA